MKYIISPEFNRNLWLRFSPFSLIAAPVLLLLVAFVCVNAGGANAPADAGMGVLSNVMLGIFFVVVILAGTYEAGTALQDEVRNSTWDFQRMSSISAAKLAFGKLFGVTAYHWYFGLMALGLFAYGYDHYQVQPYYYRYAGAPPPEQIVPDNSLWVVLVYMVLSGLMGQVLAFVSDFYDMMSVSARSGGRGRVPKGVNSFILGLICSVYIFSSIAMPVATHIQRSRYSNVLDTVVGWGGGSCPMTLFVPCSLLFFLCWFLIGAYRLARQELMHNQTPVVWLAFVCASVFWFTGFMHPGGELAIKTTPGYFVALLVAFVQVALVTYFTMLNESSDSRRYARFYNYLQQGQLRRVLENMPKWIATAPVVLGLFLAFVLYAAGLDQGTTRETSSFACLLLALMLFMVRDGFAVHAIHLGVRRRGAGFVIMFYYGITYVVLPLVAYAAMGLEPEKMLETLFKDRPEHGQMLQIAGFFFPTFTGDPSVSVFPALLQAGIAAGLLFWVLGKRRLAVPTPQVTEKNG